MLDLKKTQARVDSIKKLAFNIGFAANNISENLSKLKLPPIPEEEKIKLAMMNLKNIYLLEDQQKFFEELAQEIAGIVPLHEFVIRGFLWRSIREWQLVNKKPIILISKMTRDEQLRLGTELHEYLKGFLTRAIYMPDKERKKRYLDEVLQRFIDLFDEYLAAYNFMSNPNNQEYILNYEIENWMKGNQSLK